MIKNYCKMYLPRVLKLIRNLFIYVLHKITTNIVDQNNVYVHYAGAMQFVTSETV